ncbi:MAG: transcriptional regulator [Leptospirales bacterium]|nr:transcriptional regulator [Leptospirales bacterium]
MPAARGKKPQARKAKAKPKAQPKSKTKPRKSKPASAVRRSDEGFSPGEYVVYPMHGVGQISAIQKQSVLNKKKDYYILEIASNKMRVMVPVENARAIGIRAIIQKKDVKKVLDLLRKDEVDTEEDWKIRYQNNTAKLKSGDIYSVAEVCRNLYKRAREKELSLMERRLYEQAYNLISHEIALTRGASVEEAGNLISETLS